MVTNKITDCCSGSLNYGNCIYFEHKWSGWMRWLLYSQKMAQHNFEISTQRTIRSYLCFLPFFTITKGCTCCFRHHNSIWVWFIWIIIIYKICVWFLSFSFVLMFLVILTVVFDLKETQHQWIQCESSKLVNFYILVVQCFWLWPPWVVEQSAISCVTFARMSVEVV